MSEMSVDQLTPAAEAESERFAFGANWERFAQGLGESQVQAAMSSLVEMLGGAAIEGKSFLDVGSGSGLFSLAAVLLGAGRVRSFDYDSNSVRTTQSLKSRYAPSAAWTVEQGSALDAEFMRGLGTFDIVYSWGVLHHTGDMRRALDLTTGAVAPGGSLFISIYNDQGDASRRWRAIKRRYNELPARLRAPFVIAMMLPSELRVIAAHLIGRDIPAYMRLWQPGAGRPRGMSRWHDMIDWVGGYPFEVATPEEIFSFCTARGLRMIKMITCGGGPGCNQFVFVRDAERVHEAEPNRA